MRPGNRLLVHGTKLANSEVGELETGGKRRMSDYIDEGLSKGQQAESTAQSVLTRRKDRDDGELRHGEWIAKARSKLHLNPFTNAKFALLSVFLVLFVGSIFLFENMDILSGPLYAIKIAISSLFALSLGVILSVWWQTTARFDERIREAQRLDAEYRELLLSFSDSLFDIINALNTLTDKPPKPFVVATEFMLGEYVHLLQSQLQRYGDYVAALGLDASEFLDEKIRIFEGIREKAGLSVEGMPTEIGSLFVNSLSLAEGRGTSARSQRQHELSKGLRQFSPNPNQNSESTK
jgi:hypothetical protein